MAMTLAQLQKLAGSQIGAPENQTLAPPAPFMTHATGGATTGQGANLPIVTQPGQTPGTQATPAPGGVLGTTGGGSATSGNPWDGKTGFALANDPAYVDSQITQGYQQRYGRAPTSDELARDRGYVLKPDAYRDFDQTGQQRSGWSPYWQSRLFDPSASGGSGADLGGDSTLIPGQTPGGGALGGGASIPGMGGGMNTNGNGTSGNPLVPGNLLSPWTQQFHAPDPNQVQNDPAYQFQLTQGQNAIDRSAAARGTLVSGGTLKDIAEFGQGLASNFEDKAYSRAIGEYGMNQNTFRANQNDPFNKQLQFGQQGLEGAQALAGYGNQYANGSQVNADQTGNLETGQGNANAAGDLLKGKLNAASLADLAANLSDADWGAIFGKNTPKPNAQATA